MTNLLSWSFWFTLRPESLTTLNQKLFIALIAFLVISSIVIFLIKRKGGIYRGFFNKLYGFCLSNSLIGLILFFFSYELVPFFSARFWLGLWALIMLTWFIFIIKKLKVIPLNKKELDREKELKKYIP
ncbi:MAG: hypothetical protein ACOYL8_03335 [Patescibacteria group bacterium]